MRPLSPAEHRAVLALGPLVARHARRLRRRAPNLLATDELASYGLDGAIRAVRQFVPAAGRSLEAYATYLIRRAILDGIRSFAPAGCKRRPHNYVPTVDGDGLANFRECAVADPRPLDDADELDARLRPLSAAERAIIRCRLLGGSLKEAGRQLGLSETRASQLQASAMATLVGGVRPNAFRMLRRAAA